MKSRLAIFFRSLSALFNSGLTLTRALHVLAEQSEDREVREASRGMEALIAAGHPLSQAMSRFSHLFSELQVSLIRVGERSGSLQQVLHKLGDHEEKRVKTVLKLRNDLIYPGFLFAFCCLVLVLGPPFLFRGMLEMSTALGVEPPALTRLLLFFSDALRSPGVWLLVFLVLGGVYRLYGHLSLHHAWAEAVTERALQVPGLGRTLKVLAVTRFAHCLALQLESGQSPLTALELSAVASGNAVLKRDIALAVEALKEGYLLSESLAKTGFFPRALLQFVRAGEETGTAANLTAQAAELYDEELEFAVSSLAQLLEPLMMLVMGLLIGLVVLGTMLPLVQALRHF